MTTADDIDPPGGPQPVADLRIGSPEREAARDALQTHLIAKRLDSAEYERRVTGCELAHTQADLLRIFADLPAPHPQLPPAAAPSPSPSPEDSDNMPPVVAVGCLTLGLGVPVAIVLGFVYGTWWALAVPVAVTVLMSYVEHLRAGARAHPPEHPRD